MPLVARSDKLNAPLTLDLVIGKIRHKHIQKEKRPRPRLKTIFPKIQPTQRHIIPQLCNTILFVNTTSN
ncbi:hypothetical protein Hanom_Chr13g01230771 [Helianthus anomalus]